MINCNYLCRLLLLFKRL